MNSIWMFISVYFASFYNCVAEKNNQLYTIILNATHRILYLPILKMQREHPESGQFI